MKVSIIFNGHRAPQEVEDAYERNFLPCARKSYIGVPCGRTDLIIDQVLSTDDAAYVVDPELTPVAPIGREVLPGLKTLVVETDGFIGGEPRKLARRFMGRPVASRRLPDMFVSVMGGEGYQTKMLRPGGEQGSKSGAARVLVTVLSHCGAIAKRQAVRDAWAKDLPRGVKCLFYVGSGSADDLWRRDTVQFEYPDGYWDAPGKQMQFYKWVLENWSFDWLFQCDDDTYVAPDRLERFIDPGFDMIGTAFSPGKLHGGAGYFIKRGLLAKMVSYSSLLVPTGNTDIRFSELADVCGARKKNVHIGYIHCSNGDPTTDPAVATSHYVTPGMMLSMHRKYMASVV